MKYGTVIIFGASSGIGLATAEHLADKCKEIITVSRRESKIGQWIKTDLTKRSDINALAHQLAGKAIDALLYLGGTWERDAFTKNYSFETCSDEDLENVLNVNLLAPIRVIQSRDSKFIAKFEGVKIWIARRGVLAARNLEAIRHWHYAYQSWKCFHA